MKKVLVIGILTLLTGGVSTILSNSAGAPPGRAGDKGTSCIGCHTDNALGAQGTQVAIELYDLNKNPVNALAPNTTYLVEVSVSSNAAFSTGGFEVTAVSIDASAADPSVGAFSTDNRTQAISQGNRTYVTHTAYKPSVTNNKITWGFQWTSPAALSDGVRFYAAGIAANGDGANSGDYVATNTADYQAVTSGTAAAHLIPSTMGHIYVDNMKIHAQWNEPISSWMVMNAGGKVVSMGGKMLAGHYQLAHSLANGVYQVVVRSKDGRWFTQSLFVP